MKGFAETSLESWSSYCRLHFGVLVDTTIQQKGKVTSIKRKCGLSGRCPDAVNVNIGPV